MKSYHPVSKNETTAFKGFSVIRLFIAVISVLCLSFSTSLAQIQTSVSTLGGFIQTNTIPCPPQSYVVTGTNISADVVVTAPTGFEISTDQIAWVAPPASITIGQNGPTTIPPTTIFVRLNTAVLGTYTGNIVHSSTDASTVFLAVSGIRSVKSPTSTFLSSDINPSTTGQLVTLSVTVTSPLPGTPTGTVTFFDGASVLGTVAVNISASASLSTTAFTLGLHHLTATYNGDSNFDVSTSSEIGQYVKGTSTTVVVSNNNPSVSGQLVTFTATVSSTSPGTPTGSITFYDGVNAIAAPVVMNGGSAALSTSSLTPGSHSITAIYGGDVSFIGSTSSPLSQMVKAITTTTAQSNHNPSVSGQSVTFTATITSTTPGTVTGTVAFFDGGVALGPPIAIASGTAAYTTSSFMASTSPHSITATYYGDGNYAGSTSTTLSQTINKCNTVTVVSADHNPSYENQSVTFTATVSPSVPGSGTPTGTATFSIDGSPSGSIPLISGTSSLTTSALSIGTHVVTATYSADADFNASASAAYADTVNPTITATSGTHGSISPSGAVVVHYGSDQVFTMLPAIGYQVDSLYIDGIGQSGALTDTFFNVTANHTIHTTFSVKTDTVTILAGPNGTTNPSGIIIVQHGDSLLINFNSIPHYHVANILLDGISVGASPSLTLHDILTNHTIAVTFAIDTFTITATAGAHGTISPSGETIVSYGVDQGFMITPDAHYLVDSVVIDGISVGAISVYTFTTVADNHTITAQFKLSPAYAARYRTFMYDSMIVKKAVPKKPVTGYWEFRVTNTLSSDVNEINIVFKNDVKEIISFNGSFTATGIKKAWKFTGDVLHPLDALIIKGRSTKPKAQQIAKLFLGPVTKTPTAKSLNPEKQWQELPMPNIASARDLAFVSANFVSTPWIIGIAIPESIKSYGWVSLKKSNDMYKSLFSKTQHSLIGNGFDLIGTKPFVKAQPSLPPSKHNNKTFADLLTFKFNILLSQLGITQRGFGELRVVQPASPFDGMLLRDIAVKGDSMMTCHDNFADKSYLYLSLDSLLCELNRAFSGTIDTVSWASSLQFTGIAPLQDISYLESSGIPPIMLAPQKNPWQLIESLATAEFRLEQNYPNPFNPTTTIQFTLPFSGVVTMNVYNLLGQEVATILDHESMDEGTQDADFDATGFSSGVYFYCLTVEEISDGNGASHQTFTTIKKMILMK